MRLSSFEAPISREGRASSASRFTGWIGEDLEDEEDDEENKDGDGDGCRDGEADEDEEEGDGKGDGREGLGDEC